MDVVILGALLAQAEDSGSILGTIGIFLSGAGSILTGYLAIRFESKRGRKACDERFESLLAGMKMRDSIRHSDLEEAFGIKKEIDTQNESEK